MGNKQVSNPLRSAAILNGAGGGAARSLTQDEYSALKRRFQLSCQRGDSGSGSGLRLSKGSLLGMLSAQYINLFDKVIPSIFSVMDVKKSGAVEFDDCVCTLALFRYGSDEDKAKFLYLMYYDAKSGHMLRPQFQNLMIDAQVGEQYVKGSSVSVASMREWAVEQQNLVAGPMTDCVFFKYCKEEGKMSFSEFMSCVQAEESLYVKVYLKCLHNLFEIEPS
jgi:Ca2+-binding EF-hand superfamily protein